MNNKLQDVEVPPLTVPLESKCSTRRSIRSCRNKCSSSCWSSSKILGVQYPRTYANPKTTIAEQAIDGFVGIFEHGITENELQEYRDALEIPEEDTLPTAPSQNEQQDDETPWKQRDNINKNREAPSEPTEGSECSDDDDIDANISNSPNYEIVLYCEDDSDVDEEEFKEQSCRKGLLKRPQQEGLIGLTLSKEMVFEAVKKLIEKAHVTLQKGRGKEFTKTFDQSRLEENERTIEQPLPIRCRGWYNVVYSNCNRRCEVKSFYALTDTFGLSLRSYEEARNVCNTNLHTETTTFNKKVDVPPRNLDFLEAINMEVVHTEKTADLSTSRSELNAYPMETTIHWKANVQHF
ncbi:unnamed protein product [Allacma fusca]|uniref:Uncharacterized protein n=1 Tax=Allacma fusca TaxID=39272 RepID=A0A8J2P4A6_9HEXA|nr:unnamed protein product [Allacma fusca]